MERRNPLVEKLRENSFIHQRNGKQTLTRTLKNIARVVDILKEDHRSLCRLIAEQMGIPKTIVQQILRKDLLYSPLSTICYCLRTVTKLLLHEKN